MCACAYFSDHHASQTEKDGTTKFNIYCHCGSQINFSVLASVSENWKKGHRESKVGNSKSAQTSFINSDKIEGVLSSALAIYYKKAYKSPK